LANCAIYIPKSRRGEIKPKENHCQLTTVEKKTLEKNKKKESQEDRYSVQD